MSQSGRLRKFHELPLSTHGSTQIQAMWQQGYAPVGVVVNLTQSDPNTYLGER